MGHNVGNDLSDAIIGLIGTRGPLSRASIARQLGVSPASITHLTRSLIEEGVLREAGTDASSGGRPATLLDLNDRRRYALGVKITPNHLAVTEVEMNKEQGPSTSLDLDMRSPALWIRSPRPWPRPHAHTRTSSWESGLRSQDSASPRTRTSSLLPFWAGTRWTWVGSYVSARVCRSS